MSSAGPAILRLLFVVDAAVANVDELPPEVRAVIEAAPAVYVLTPTLPARLAWLADDVDSSEHANWQEKGPVEHVEERFGLAVTAYAVDHRGHTTTADGPVLLCYDGSEDATHAIERAGALFAGRNALVLTVWHPTTALGSFAWAGATESMVDFFEEDRAAAELGGRVAGEGVRIALAAGLDAEPIAVEATGPVWETIVETADRTAAATIVMGSRGLTGLRSMLLGSVSSAVVHHANRPTLVVRQPADAVVPRR